ncbi:hypothetical protein C6P45_002462 [Maudiozyma exigua]|uniref:Uncharacterized protein n=1 Tax=Maudiozyma exigua TaxID=34358 RepID=A0A9P6VYB6_MAUEX|nr:hypothetical protein C6P45_002462 [Kazachstania exigua]
MMMKLVMVDPSKSGKDKVRSNTFHHFKKTETNASKGSEKSRADAVKIAQGNKPIVFHRFADDIGSSPVATEHRVENSNAYSNHAESSTAGKSRNLGNAHTDSIHIPSRIKTQKKMMNRLDFQKNNINEDGLVIKVDPRYNTGMDKSISKYHILKSQNKESPHHEPMKDIPPHIGSPINKNKVKKVTFVNNVSKLSGKTHDMINGSNRNTYYTESFPAIKDAVAGSSKRLDNINKIENSTLKKSNRITSMCSLDEPDMPINFNEINKNEQTITETKLSSNKRDDINSSHLKHHVTKDYSTYKFKINVADGKSTSELYDDD